MVNILHYKDNKNSYDNRKGEEGGKPKKLSLNNLWIRTSVIILYYYWCDYIVIKMSKCFGKVNMLEQLHSKSEILLDVQKFGKWVLPT